MLRGRMRRLRRRGLLGELLLMSFDVICKPKCANYVKETQGIFPQVAGLRDTCFAEIRGKVLSLNVLHTELESEF